MVVKILHYSKCLVTENIVKSIGLYKQMEYYKIINMVPIL